MGFAEKAIVELASVVSDFKYNIKRVWLFFRDSLCVTQGSLYSESVMKDVRRDLYYFLVGGVRQSSV